MKGPKDLADGHPILSWIIAVFSFVMALGTVGGVYWYFQEERIRNAEWYEDDVRWNNRQREKLKSIISYQQESKKSLATHSVVLAELHTLIRDYGKQRENRFEELEGSTKELLGPSQLPMMTSIFDWVSTRVSPGILRDCWRGAPHNL